MKFHKLNSFYIVTDVTQHDYLKDILLKYIDEMPEASIDDGIEVVSKTDWNIPEDYERDYLNFFHKIFEPSLTEMALKLRCTEWKIHNMWYQVYNRGDKHDWHAHPGANYSNVYYLSLPNKSISTQLYDPMNNKVIKNIKVREGQVLTFAGNIIHRSPVNNDDNQKVVISFNSSFTDPSI
tara:strand:+ start:126 stop:665 length:540 start_codon:yes stop_codon:yes gene_type:complete